MCCYTGKDVPNFKRSDVRAIQTARSKHVMALPTLNYSDRLPSILTSNKGLYLLNSARIVKGTLNVNETLELIQSEFNEVVWKDHASL